MKRSLCALFLLIAMLLQGGCSLSRQPEHQAFVVTMGVDRAGDDQIEIWVQVPNIGAKSAQASEGKDSSGYEIFSTRAESIPAALDLLRASIPSTLQISLMKSLVIAQDVAMTDRFPEIIDALITRSNANGNAAVIITRGKARDFLEAQKPSIGIRLSAGVVALLEQFHSNGYIPLITLQGLYSASHSFYSDPVITLADTVRQPSPQEGKAQDIPSEAGNAPMSEDGSLLAGDAPRSGPNANQYLGCALMRAGIMVGVLDGQSCRLLSILRHEVATLNYETAGESMRLTRQGAPQIKLNLKENGLSLSVDLVFTTAEPMNAAKLNLAARSIENDVYQLMQRCQAAGVEPFNLSELAAGRFATYAAFKEYAFRENFCAANLRVRVQVLSRIE